MGGAPPLGLAASGLLPRLSARAPRVWRCPCPPHWGRGLGLGAALGGEPAARSHAPIASASPRVWGRPRAAGTGRGGKGAQGSARWRAGCPAACVRSGTILAGGGERRRPEGSGVSASPWPPRVTGLGRSVPEGRGVPGCEHPQPWRAASESAAFVSGAGRAGPRFGARRNCEAKSRKQSGALERTEGSRLARAAAV